MYFPVERVAVCALKFVPQLASIAVGFNFGSFQVSLIFLSQSKYGKIQGWPMQLWPLFENDELLKHPCSVAFVNGTSQDALDENRGLFLIQI